MAFPCLLFVIALACIAWDKITFRQRLAKGS